MVYCPSNGVVTWDVPAEFNNDYTITANRLTLNSGPTYEILEIQALWITASVYNPATGLTTTSQTKFWTQSCYGNNRSSNQLPKVNVSPNPSTGQFVVKLNATDKNSAIQEVRVKNKMGVIIYRKKFNNKQQQQQIIDLQSALPDIYVAEIFDGKQWVSQKIIIKR